MDKLVRVRRLLQRLDFLFQLPQKLEDAVQEGQYSKAVRFFLKFLVYLPTSLVFHSCSADHVRLQQIMSEIMNNK